MTTTNNTDWTFRSLTFRRLLTGTDDARWFAASVTTSIDLIATTDVRIIDIGGVSREPLAFIALMDDSADANSLAAMLGTSGTLTSPAGQTTTALLVQADRLVADGATFRVRARWEVVS
jgi:hypothetical protein